MFHPLDLGSLTAQEGSVSSFLAPLLEVAALLVVNRVDARLFISTAGRLTNRKQ